MYWTDPAIDFTGTLDGLRLAPLQARILLDASLRIHDTGLRALLTTAILSHEPHRIRTDRDRIQTGYHLDGGRSLRAAVMARALMLLDGPTDADSAQRLMAAAILGNLVPAGHEPAVDTRRRWLDDLVDSEREHLAEWGCDRACAREVIDHSFIAAHRHIDLHPARGSSTDAGSRMLRACQAAALARPLLPRVLCDPIPLPAWMDPDRSSDDALRRLQKEASSPYSQRMLGPSGPILWLGETPVLCA